MDLFLFLSFKGATKTKKMPIAIKGMPNIGKSIGNKEPPASDVSMALVITKAVIVQNKQH